MAQAAAAIDQERRALAAASQLADLQQARRALEAAPLAGPRWNPVIKMFSLTALRYQVSADGYRLWSVGRNELDDGGRAQDELDLVLERPSPQ